MRLSVIIPTLNEAAGIGVLIQQLNTSSAFSEIIVSDGGSRDATCEIARSLGACIVEPLPQTARNRGAQLQRGAQAATGEAFWFLHADARPHPQSAAAIVRALDNPRIIGGNFRLKFDSDQPAARVFERIARLQRLRGIYYGDSGLFVRRAIYSELGGFTNWPLFEDYEFVRRLEKLAHRRQQYTICLPWSLTASARRFAHRPWQTLGQWALFQTLFAAGVLPQRLAAIYHR